ncbi:CopG family transcriptional regulator [Brevibacillus agri]|uniref:ribbon-helix-helix domain-containing protein n=1 Tax=Brevibacillus agri TaxID=51101 RepID=UPI003D198E0C
MFERRKRNLNLLGTREHTRQGETTHGINWSRDQRQEKSIANESTHDMELEYGWEEVGEETVMEPRENFRQHPPIGQPGLAFSDRQNAKIASFRQPDPSYPGLQRRPDFYEQHKKLTVYVEKDLLETIETLKKGRYISSYSWLVTEAIKQYLSIKK